MYLRRFFALNPLLLFVGLLELLQELTKFVTFSFRLFGNISAGEAVLGTMSALLAFIVPIPFLAFELLVAVIQGLVFALLTMAFMTMLTEPHHTEERAGEHRLQRYRRTHHRDRRAWDRASASASSGPRPWRPSGATPRRRARSFPT